MGNPAGLIGEPSRRDGRGRVALLGQRQAMPDQQEKKDMTILRLFRSTPLSTNHGETTEVSRLLKRGPFDRPTGLRETHCFNRSLDGRW